MAYADALAKHIDAVPESPFPTLASKPSAAELLKRLRVILEDVSAFIFNEHVSLFLSSRHRVDRSQVDLRVCDAVVLEPEPELIQRGG